MKAYCKNCKREVKTRFTTSQFYLLSLSLLLVIPGIIYCFTHKKFCPICTIEIDSQSNYEHIDYEHKSVHTNEDVDFNKLVELYSKENISKEELKDLKKKIKN